MRKELLEKAERIARRIPNRRITEAKDDTEERRAKWQKCERQAQRIEKKQRAEANFDRDLRRAIEYTRDILAAQDCYNRLAGNYELKHVGDECRTLIGEAPLLNAEPKRAPDYEGDGEYRHVDPSEHRPAPRADKEMELYLAGPWFGPRTRRDFSDWRKIWTANHKAHVNMRCTLDEIAPHCYVSRRDNHYRHYGWKPYEEKAAGPNLKAAAAWLTAKRYGYLFDEAYARHVLRAALARKSNPAAEEPQPWKYYGPPIAAHAARRFVVRHSYETPHNRGWIVPWDYARHGSWYAWLKRKGAHNLGVDATTKPYEAMRNLDVADANQRIASADAGTLLANAETVGNREEAGCPANSGQTTKAA